MNGLRSILVDVDATASAQPALQWAEQLAERSGAMLTVVDVVPGSPGRGAGERTFDERRARLEGLATRALAVDGRAKLLRGRPAKAILDEVVASGHDLVVRAHTRELARADPRSFGAVDRTLLRKCPCPVLLVGHGAPGPRLRIAAAVDASRHAEDPGGLGVRILRAAFDVAALLEAPPPIVVYAWNVSGEQSIRVRVPAAEFAAYERQFRRRAAADLASLVAAGAARASAGPKSLRRGDPDSVIPQLVVSEGIELVVMGTVARSGAAGLLIGNTAERLLRRLPCSILILRPDAPAGARRLRAAAAVRRTTARSGGVRGASSRRAD
jgi:nucleotide-binding universal stress UspA family protein